MEKCEEKLKETESIIAKKCTEICELLSIIMMFEEKIKQAKTDDKEDIIDALSIIRTMLNEINKYTDDIENALA